MRRMLPKIRNRLEGFGVSEQDVKAEWHRQPVSTVIHIITLLVMVAGFGGLIQNLSYRNALLERRQDMTDHLMREDSKAVSSNAADILVLKTRLDGIENGVSQINRKIDYLVEEKYEHDAEIGSLKSPSKKR